MAEDPTSLKMVAKRLRALRGASEMTQQEMAAVIGSPNSNSLWAQYEGAVISMPPDRAKFLAARFGVTLDWIYLGNEGMMPPDLMRRIRAFVNPVSRSKPRQILAALCF